MKKYPCPCCGFKTFKEYPGSDEICPVCFWQDNLISLDYMYNNVGPNHISLQQAQINYAEFGAKEMRLREHTREPTEDEPKDFAWRVLNPSSDHQTNFMADDPLDKIYYWLREPNQ